MASVISAVLVAAFAALAGGMVLAFVRVAAGPTLADRVLAVDTMTIAGVGLMAIAGIVFDATVFLDIALILVIAGFVSTAAFAQLIEQGVLGRPGGRR